MDRKAFEKLIEAARPALTRRARRELAEHEVEDAVQDAMVIALAKDGWEMIEKPANWVLGVMDNVIVSVVRKRRYPDDFDVEAAVSDLNAYDDLIETMVHDQDVAERVARLMRAAEKAHLTRREDYVFLARLRGVPDVQTGRTLGIEANAVRSYFSLAVKKVRAVVEDDALEAATVEEEELVGAYPPAQAKAKPPVQAA